MEQDKCALCSYVPWGESPSIAKVRRERIIRYKDNGRGQATCEMRVQTLGGVNEAEIVYPCCDYCANDGVHALPEGPRWVSISITNSRSTPAASAQNLFVPHSVEWHGNQ